MIPLMPKRLSTDMRRAARETAGRLIENLEPRLLLAGQTVDLNFDKLAAGTIVANQFSKQGVIFSGTNVRETVAAVGARAHSIENVLNISVPAPLTTNPTPNLTGQFSGNVDDVSMFVGAMSAPIKGPFSARGRAVTAYGAWQRPIVAQSTITVADIKFLPPHRSEGTKTAAIRRFTLAAYGAPIGVDDIRYLLPPTFSISPAASTVTIVGVRWRQINDNLTITRIFGSTGNIDFFGHRPADRRAWSRRLHADHGYDRNHQRSCSSLRRPFRRVATPPGGVPITITGTPSSSSVSDGPLSTTITLNVVPALTATFPRPIQHSPSLETSAVGFSVLAAGRALPDR